MNIRGAILALATLLFTGGAAHAALNLTQLSACDDLGRIDMILKRGDFSCRPPAGALELRLASVYRPAESRICFLQSPPTASLSGFDCVVEQASTDELHIACFRLTDMQVVREYQQNYNVYAGAVASYLKAASRCPIGNGDASAAGRNVSPPLLWWIARYLVGFTLPVGGSLVGSTAFVHGYAQVDPALVGSDQAAIEFLSYWVKP